MVPDVGIITATSSGVDGRSGPVRRARRRRARRRRSTGRAPAGGVAGGGRGRRARAASVTSTAGSDLGDEAGELARRSSVGFTGTWTAPTSMRANQVSRCSGRFDAVCRTRSSGPTPWARNHAAARSMRACASAKVSVPASVVSHGRSPASSTAARKRVGIVRSTPGVSARAPASARPASTRWVSWCRRGRGVGVRRRDRPVVRDRGCRAGWCALRAGREGWGWGFGGAAGVGSGVGGWGEVAGAVGLSGAEGPAGVGLEVVVVAAHAVEVVEDGLEGGGPVVGVVDLEAGGAVAAGDAAADVDPVQRGALQGGALRPRLTTARMSTPSATMAALKASPSTHSRTTETGTAPTPAISQSSPSRAWPRWRAVSSTRTMTLMSRG